MLNCIDFNYRKYLCKTHMRNEFMLQLIRIRCGVWGASATIFGIGFQTFTENIGMHKTFLSFQMIPIVMFRRMIIIAAIAHRLEQKPCHLSSAPIRSFLSGLCDSMFKRLFKLFLLETTSTWQPHSKSCVS